MKCEEVQKFIYIYLDNEMEEADRREVMAHITGCAACTRMIALERAALKTIRARAPRDAAPQWFKNRIAARVQGASSVVLFFRELKLHPLAAAAAAAAFLVILTVQHAGTFFTDKSPSAARSIAALVPGAMKMGMHPVFSGARASLTGAGILNVNARAAGRRFNPTGAPHIIYTGFDTLHLRPSNVRHAYVPARRGVPAGRGYLGAPRLNPYGVHYAMAGAEQGIDADEVVYFDDVDGVEQ